MLALVHSRAINSYMAKTPNKKVTVNIRIYADTHALLKKHVVATHQSLAGVIHQFATTLSQ